MHKNTLSTHHNHVKGFNTFKAFTLSSNKPKCVDYSNTVYTNSSTKLLITCTIHGEFTQLPHNHIKYGCPLCSNVKMSENRRSNTEEFIAKATALHSTAFDYSATVYGLNNTAKVSIKCNECYTIFKQSPMKHLAGRGCPICNGHKNKYTPCVTTLYYLKVNDGEAYKIGITIKPDILIGRYSPQDRDRLEVLFTKNFPTGKEAYLEEQRILTEFKEYKYKGIPLLETGNSELFVKDVLLLDKNKEPTWQE